MATEPRLLFKVCPTGDREREARKIQDGAFCFYFRTKPSRLAHLLCFKFFFARYCLLFPSLPLNIYINIYIYGCCNNSIDVVYPCLRLRSRPSTNMSDALQGDMINILDLFRQLQPPRFHGVLSFLFFSLFFPYYSRIILCCYCWSRLLFFSFLHSGAR